MATARPDQAYYSPGMGKFLSADPYMASAGAESPGSWNRYAYVEGDPANFSDPEGLFRSAAGFQFMQIDGIGGSSAGLSFVPRLQDDPWGGELWDVGFSLHETRGGGELPPADPCDELSKQIDKLPKAVRGSDSTGFKGLDQSLRQLTRMSRNDPAWDGHVQQINQRRRELEKVLDHWDNQDCGDCPPRVQDVLTRPVLSNEDIRALRTADRMLRISLGAVGGYAGYRLIRLLPSLLPPLWWTLPGNVAVP